MKTLAVVLTLFYIAAHAVAQEPLSQAEALGQLYQQYDDAHRTAQWSCAPDKKADGPCWVGEDAKVSVTLLLTAELDADGKRATYVVASARPNDKERWECHVCGPAIGVAVFVLQSDRWVLQSKNEATGFFGSFGEPGDVSLVAVGPHRHGVMLSTDYGGQGYYESTETLLLPLGANVAEVWSEKVRLDDQRDDDPIERKISNRLQYVSSSGISFYWVGGPTGSLRNEYYDIALVTHRSSFRIRSQWAKQDCWQDTYRFDGTRYVRTSHEAMTRIARSPKRAPASKKS